MGHGYNDIDFTSNWRMQLGEFQIETSEGIIMNNFSPTNFDINSISPTTDSYTSQFASEEETVFVGYGLDKDNWPKTLKMLSRLALRMKIPSEDNNEENSINKAIPAGYTYLGQMIAHDMVATGGLFPVEPRGSNGARNFRTNPLLLSSIYGSGPELTPQPYAIEDNLNKPRRKFRLGKTRLSNNDSLIDGAARDIPRTACPYLSDQMQVEPDNDRILPTDTLIADARNDDNLIISQLTALFHFFHNKVLDQVDEHDNGSNSKRNFHFARLIVTRAYRRIIRQDFLKLVLNEKIYQLFEENYDEQITSGSSEYVGPFGDLPQEPADGRIALEFSHGAFRFGHAMVSSTYHLNKHHQDGSLSGPATISDILKFTSANSAIDMPLSCEWLVDGWQRFFQSNADIENRSSNFSRSITPFVSAKLTRGSQFPTADKRPGGLIYRDFARAAAVGVKSVNWLLEKYELADSPEYVLGVKENRLAAIKEWLERVDEYHYLDPDLQLDEKDMDHIAGDPPLLFYILLEAELLEDGEKLGPLGSIIVAETIYRALAQSSNTDNDTLNEKIDEFEQVIFQDGRLNTMPKLIHWLEVDKNWSKCPADGNMA